VWRHTFSTRTRSVSLASDRRYRSVEFLHAHNVGSISLSGGTKPLQIERDAIPRKCYIALAEPETDGQVSLTGWSP